MNQYHFIDFFKVLKLIVTCKVPCLLYSRYHIYCPGCGGTRAVIQLLKGHVLTSFLLHPLVLYTVVLLICYLVSNAIGILLRCRDKIGMKLKPGYLVSALVLLIVNWVVKNIFLCGFHMDILQLLNK